MTNGDAENLLQAPLRIAAALEKMVAMQERLLMMLVAPPEKREVPELMTTHAKPPRRAALETPFEREHERSLGARLAKGRMPKALPALLRWYSEAWDLEIPDKLHKVEVWHDYAEHGEGGSQLGSPAWSDPFRRYLENTDSELDEDGYYKRPVHAALSRMGRRWPITGHFLFAVAQSGYDWRGVAERVHWAEEPFAVFLGEALRMLWREYAEQRVRLE